MASNPTVVSGSRAPGTVAEVVRTGPAGVTLPGLNPHEGDVIFTSQYPQLQVSLGWYGTPYANMRTGRMTRDKLWVRFMPGVDGGYLRLNPLENPEDQEKIDRLRKHAKNGSEFVEHSVAMEAAKKERQAKYLAMVDSDPELRAALEVRLNAKALPLPPRDSEAARVAKPKKGADSED